MTCIVAITHNSKVLMGADSAGVAGQSLTIRRDTKVFEKANMLIGCTTSFRMIQLLRFSLVVPKRHPDVDVYEYMCTDFIDAVRNTFRSGGFLTKEHEAEWGGQFLVGYEGRLFFVDTDYQVGECYDGFNACGSGAEIAKGSLFESAANPKPRDRLEAALTAAAHFCAGVRAPFTFVGEES